MNYLAMDVASRGQDHLKGKLSGSERRIRMLEALR